MPQPPDDSDDYGCGEEVFALELFEQVSAPAYFLAEGEKGIDGCSCHQARQKGYSYHAYGFIHTTERHRFTRGVKVKAYCPMGEENRKQWDKDYDEPANEPPAVDFPADADTAKEGFFGCFLADECCHQRDEHAEASQ